MSETLFHRTQLQFHEERSLWGKKCKQMSKLFWSAKIIFGSSYLRSDFKRVEENDLSNIGKEDGKNLAVTGSKRNILSFCVLMLKSTLLPPFHDLALKMLLFIHFSFCWGICERVYTRTLFHLLILTALWWEEERTLLSYYCRKEKDAFFLVFSYSTVSPHSVSPLNVIHHYEIP